MKKIMNGRNNISRILVVVFILTLILGINQLIVLAATSTQGLLDITKSNWELTQGYSSVVDKTGAVGFTGGTAYNDRVTYKNSLDVSGEVSFDIKFTSQALANGTAFIGITLGKDNDSFNNNSKGITFILYKKSDGVIECAQNPGPWWEFPFAETNTVKIKKGTDGWELYFKNSVFKTEKLIATVPFTTVGANIFSKNKAKLSIVTSDSKDNTIKFEVSNLTNKASSGETPSAETPSTEAPASTAPANEDNTGNIQTLPEDKNIYVLPTNSDYWQCGQNSTYKNGILTLGNGGSGLYTGSNLVNRVSQFKMSATIPSGKWIGYLLRQSNPGSAPWDQMNAYLIIVKSDGVVEVNKYINKAVTVITTGTTTAFQTSSAKTVRIGAVDEGNGVRLVFDIDGKTVINYLDNSNPIKTHGSFSMLTLETANAKIYTGPAGTDKDKSGDTVGGGTQSLPTGETQTLAAMDKTYVLPTNSAYWECGQNTSYKDGILTIGNAGFGLYTGSNLVNRIPQFKMAATIPGGKWVGFLLRQSNPGIAPWEQKNAYLVIIKSDGGVEVNKYINKAATVITTGTTTAFQTSSAKSVRVGVIDEGSSVRLVFDIDGKTVINYLDSKNPITTHGSFSILTLETANAKVYTGPAGTDKDNAGDLQANEVGTIQPVLSIDTKGIGMGYTGGAIVRGVVNRLAITDDSDLDSITENVTSAKNNSDKSSTNKNPTGKNNVNMLYITLLVLVTLLIAGFGFYTVSKIKVKKTNV